MLTGFEETDTISISVFFTQPNHFFVAKVCSFSAVRAISTINRFLLDSQIFPKPLLMICLKKSWVSLLLLFFFQLSVQLYIYIAQ